MLKPCARPYEVLIGTRLLIVGQSIGFQKGVIPVQLRRQLRQKSSNSRGPKSRYLPDDQHPPSAVKDRSFSKARPRSFESPAELVSQSPSSDLSNAVVGRPILLNPIKPAPLQDLSSTRPAKLESPSSPDPDAGGNVSISERAKYLFRLGKSFVNFYKAGLKNIWRNRKEYNEIKARLRGFSPVTCALYGGLQPSFPASGAEPVNTQRVPTITRREFQLCLRTKYDLGKLIPFGIVFAICGEFTPLVIVALGSSVVPKTCRIPKQVEHDQKWFVKRMQQGAHNRVIQMLQHDSKKLDPEVGNAVAYLHGISPVAELPPVVGNLFYHVWIKPRMIRRGFEMLADAVLIRREGGLKNLEAIEVWDYSLKFFYPPFVSLCVRHQEKFGKLPSSSDARQVATLIAALERDVTSMLVQDWETIPEPDRFISGFLYNSADLSSYADTIDSEEKMDKISSKR